MRMIVAGGGTGGHLFPGLAVAECAAAAGDEVLFVGSSHGIEARVIPQTTFGFRSIPIRGFRGRGWKGAAAFAVRFPASLLRAWRAIGEFGCDVVLGVGGYASFPVVIAAWLRRVPSVLLEQNARPGWANQVLAHLARRVCTTFPTASEAFPAGKAILTGNPVRPLVVPPTGDRSSLTLFVFGGSQGAHRINEALYAAAPKLRDAIPDLRIIHQTGAADCDWIRDRYAELGVTADVRDFIDDMAAAYAEADLVICRAGATTVAELTALGKPAILVPYPFAADDHQRANANVLAEREAAILILDRELDGARLAATVVELGQDRERREAMGDRARALGMPDAAANVLAVCREIGGEVRADG